MVQIIEQPGTLSSRIGRGIGQGLKEQLPKEVERYRLSKGIENLAGESNLTPIQQLAKLYSLPGGSEAAPAVLPFLERQQRRTAMKTRREGELSAPGARPGVVPEAGRGAVQQPQGQEAPEAVKRKPLMESGFAPSSEITRYKENLLQPATMLQIEELANEYLDLGYTQDPTEARSLARNELDTNRAAQQEKNQTLRKDLSQRLQLNLQGGGIGDFKDVAGEIQSKLIDQGEYLVNELGLSPEAASEKINDIATALGKTATQAKAVGSISNIFTSPKSKINSIKDQRKKFAKYGFGEQFDDMATHYLGITPQRYASEFDPLKNKGIESVLKKHSTSFGHKGIQIKKIKPKEMDQLILDIKPSDNILSIEQGLRERNIDINQFKERLRDAVDERKVALTDLQQRQLEKPVSNFMFGDILWDARR